jgi:hypothetical protein
MAHIVKKDSGGEPNPLDNHILTSDGLRNKLAQLGAEHLFYELEALEVMDISDGRGTIVGRYVVSEEGDSPSELQEFLPLNANILQIPIVGEIVLGFSDKATQQRYYFGRLNTDTNRVNFQNFNLSSVGDKSKNDDEEGTLLNSNKALEDYTQGNYFVDTEPPRVSFSEGDTIIQGRFGNSVILGSNQVLGEEKSPNINLLASDGQFYPNESSIKMTTSEKIVYSEPTNELAPLMGKVLNSAFTGSGEDSDALNIDYAGPQIIFDSDRIMINAKSNDIGIFAQGDIFIKGNRVNIENSEAVSIVTNEMVTDYSNGVKKDITKKISDIDGDTKLLPANLLPYAEQMKPHIENINNGVISAASKILPPVIAPGVINPLNISGHLLDLKFFRDQIRKIKDFFDFEWVDKQEWKTTSLNDVTEALGLNDLKTLETPEWNEFFDDIDAAKTKVANIQAQAAASVIAVATLNAAFDAIQGGGGSTQSIIEALDAYEADPNNPPLDTTDIRDIISDGAESDDVKNYLDFGGSPQVRELLVSSQQKEQDAQKLSSMGIIAELINMGENI